MPSASGPVSASEPVGAAGSGVVTGTDLAALLADLTPDIVFNCSPPAAHRTVTTSALEHGCAVLSEKPMAMTLAEARDLCSVSERTGRLLAVTQDRRQLSGTRALKEAARRLAPLTRLEIDFRLPHRAGPYVHLWDEPLLREMAIHLFDAARAVTGADAQSVFCTAYRTPWSWYPGNDSAEALFQMDDGLALRLHRLLDRALGLHVLDRTLVPRRRRRLGRLGRTRRAGAHSGARGGRARTAFRDVAGRAAVP